MVQINKKEKERVLKFSNNYISIHGEIVSVEKEIKKLEESSANLISELERCREEESCFMERMIKKYGPGRLNPMTLCWEPESLQEEIKS